MPIVFQIACTLFIIAALVYFIKKNSRSSTGASKGQMILAGFQLLLCGWFFSLCLSDVLDISVDFSYIKFVLNVFYAMAFLTISIFTLFNKHRNNDRDLKAVVLAFIVLIGMQCFVFPYGKEIEFLRIIEAIEGAVVFGLLITVLLKLHEDKLCQKCLFIATVLELAVSIENLIVPFSEITDDVQLIDIPLNYAALFMRPVLFASLALAYRVWLDGQKNKATN